MAPSGPAAAPGMVGRVVHATGIVLAFGSALYAADEPAGPAANRAVYVGAAAIVAALSPLGMSIVQAVKADRQAARKARAARDDLLGKVEALRREAEVKDRLVGDLRDRVDRMGVELLENRTIFQDWVASQDRAAGGEADAIRTGEG